MLSPARRSAQNANVPPRWRTLINIKAYMEQKKGGRTKSNTQREGNSACWQSALSRVHEKLLTPLFCGVSGLPYINHDMGSMGAWGRLRCECRGHREGTGGSGVEIGEGKDPPPMVLGQAQLQLSNSWRLNPSGDHLGQPLGRTAGSQDGLLQPPLPASCSS